MPEEIAQAVQNPNAAGKEESSRTAFPSIPAAGDLTYDISARIGSTVYASGKINADGKSYSIGIPATDTEKNYTIHVDAIYDEKIILSGDSQSFSVSLAEPLVEVPAFKLSADKTSSLPGNVKLVIDVSGTEINKLLATFPNSSEMSSTASSGKIEFQSLLTKAAHSIKFSFYDASNILLYSFTEIINVFSNMTTNTWVQKGNEPWFVTTTDTSGKKTTVCRITSAMVDGFKLTQIYVDSTRSTSSGDANYTTESGTFINPCTSFSKAIEKLTASTKDYTINLKGSYNLQTIPASINARTLTVCDNSATIKTFAQNAAIPVTFKNLTIENAGAESHGGGIKNQGNLTLDNCIIQSCDGDVFNGGGVFNNGTLNLLSGTITGNTAQNGAGVFIEDGKEMTMSGGTISGNESGGSSGAVHVGTNSLFTMSGGTISGNTAFEGGGVFIEDHGTFIMSGGTISGNSANTGGALYVEGTFKMKGSAYIPAGVRPEGGTLQTGAGKNDVRLFGDHKIIIAGKLTPPAACTDGIVATITPASYTAGTQLIELDTGATDTTLEDAAAHFAVTQPVDGTNLFFVSNEGKLATITPVLSFDNGEEDGTQTNPDNGKVYDVVKYSYLGDDNLKVSAVNPYEDSGFAIDLLVDGTSGDLTARTVDDGYHTLTIRVSKAGYASVDISKRVYVKIKPVNVSVPKVKGFLTRGDGYRISLNVYLYIQAKNGETYTEQQEIAHWTGVYDTDFNSEPATNFTPVVLTDRNSTFYFYTSQANDEWNTSGPLGIINRGHSYTTRTLEALKEDKTFDSQCVNSSGNTCGDNGRRSHYWFTVTLDDSD